MDIIGITLTALASLSAIGAVLYQWIDHKKDYGSTMGGRMTSGAIWSIAALLGGVGVGMLMTWYWGLAAFALIYVTSFAIRGAIERALLNFDGQGTTGEPKQTTDGSS